MNDVLIKLNTKSEHCENCRNYIPAIKSEELYIDEDSATRAWKIELGCCMDSKFPKCFKKIRGENKAYGEEELELYP